MVSAVNMNASLLHSPDAGSCIIFHFDTVVCILEHTSLQLSGSSEDNTNI